MKAGDEYITEVEKLTSRGVGLCRANGFVVFAQSTCPGDEIRIKITKVNKNYAEGKVLEIIKPSKYRTKPFCPMHNVCGACQLQFIDYEYQLKIKQDITQDAMRTIGALDIKVNETIPSPIIKNYRCKTQYPVSRTKNSRRILAGYYKAKTHEIVNIKYCPIQPQICGRIIEFIRENARNFGIEGFIEKNHTGDLRHVVIRHSKLNGQNLVVLVVNAEKTFDRLDGFAKCIYDNFDEVAGVCANFNTKKTNVILGGDTQCLCGDDFIEEKLLDKIFKISSDTFFQINPASAENIFEYVKNYLTDNFDKPVVLDAYAGITAFGITAADICKKVVSVEENEKSCNLACDVAGLNKITNIEINNTDTAEFLSKENRKFDAVILDPPRKGCSRKALDEALRLAKDTIIYVSCSPATLARDLKYLHKKGAKVESIQPFDMFCHTYHIENAAIIKV